MPERTPLINTGIPAVHSESGRAIPGTRPAPPVAACVSLAQAALSSPTHRETRRPDGTWPFARAEMRSARRIRERLIEDARALIARRGAGSILLTDDFLRLGWGRAQINEHGRAAMPGIALENACGNEALGPEVA
ncbi:MAG: hypothetical protein IOC67_08425 [Methylobacterium sp.]|nr:hypothetical protein [Methylobacterium sp.]